MSSSVDGRRLSANGHPVDTAPQCFGTLRDSTELLDEPDAMRSRFDEDGYLFLPGFLDAELVLDARREILTKYAIVGEIDDRRPLDDAVAGAGEAVPHVNLRAFSESVRTGHHYTQVVMDEALLAAVSTLLGGAAAPFSMRWPRFVRPGEGCGFHCDGPYMNRGTDRQLSTWIPLGHVEPHEGALMVLEGSHVNADLHAGYLRKDADRDGLVWLEDDPEVVRRAYGQRWLTTTFEPGDVLAFSMNTLHGALDNNSTTGRCRLSSDSRYYLAGETPDPRWTGDTIEGHGEGRVFYPGLGRWNNEDFQDEWKKVDDLGRMTRR